MSILDVISLVELVTDGSFETGNLTDWNYCYPNRVLNEGRIGSSGAFAPNSDNYFYHGAAYPDYDYLSQTVAKTDIKLTYLISFWLGNEGIGTNRALVTWY